MQQHIRERTRRKNGQNHGDKVEGERDDGEEGLRVQDDGALGKNEWNTTFAGAHSMWNPQPLTRDTFCLL